VVVDDVTEVCEPRDDTDLARLDEGVQELSIHERDRVCDVEAIERRVIELQVLHRVTTQNGVRNDCPEFVDLGTFSDGVSCPQIRADCRRFIVHRQNQCTFEFIDISIDVFDLDVAAVSTTFVTKRREDVTVELVGHVRDSFLIALLGAVVWVVYDDLVVSLQRFFERLLEYALEHTHFGDETRVTGHHNLRSVEIDGDDSVESALRGRLHQRDDEGWKSELVVSFVSVGSREREVGGDDGDSGGSSACHVVEQEE